MTRELGRMVFIGNPWPGGHAIASCTLTGALEPATGLVLRIALESAEYDAEVSAETLDAGAARKRGSWNSPTVWQNFHRCHLHTRDGAALVAASRERRLDTRSSAWAFSSDPAATYSLDEYVIGIYLLGHDAVADHEIVIGPTPTAGILRVEWRGRIALAYIGDDEFRYRFEAILPALPFTGFAVADGISDDDAHALLAAVVTDPGRFELTAGPRRFVVRPTADPVGGGGPRFLRQKPAAGGVSGSPSAPGGTDE